MYANRRNIRVLIGVEEHDDDVRLKSGSGQYGCFVPAQCIRP